MPGQIAKLIDTIIEKRSKGDPIFVSTTKTKLILKGINLTAYTNTSPDDPLVIEKLTRIAKELGVQL